MRRIFLSMIFSLLALCAGTSPGYAAKPEPGPIRIGWIGPLTGDSAFLGVDSVEAARMVFEDLNSRGGIKGRRIELVAEDDQYQSARTVSAYTKLVSLHGVRAIIVITYGGLVAIAQRAEKDGVLLFDPLDCDEQLAALPANTFCIAKKTEDMGLLNARHALRSGLRKAGILFVDGDPFLPLVAESTRNEFEAGGGSVVVFSAVTQQQPDPVPSLVRAKESGAEVLFLYGYEWFSATFKRARELGLTGPFYSITNLETPGARAAGGESLKGVIASGWFAPHTPAYTAFLGEYAARVGRRPLLEISTLPTVDIARLLVRALQERSGPDGETRLAALREAIYNVRNYQGLSGLITMDADGAVRSLPVGLYVFDGVRYTPVP